MDLKVQVIASNITNLTDARYFAAYGVHYLLFDLREISISAIKEIVDWVSGPKTLILINKEHAEDIDEAVLKLEPYAIGATDDLDLSYLSGHVKLMEASADDANLTIDLDHVQYSTRYVPAKQSNLIIRGSHEDKVRFKSFEDLDDILESLVIEY